MATPSSSDTVSPSSNGQPNGQPVSLPGTGEHGVLLFDGVCNLCNGFVNFVIDHDPDGYFKLGALQSDAARPYLEHFEVDPNALDSVVLIENGVAYHESTAALRVARHLTGPWPLLYAFVVVPRPLRDRVYRWIAENRYRWFGQRDECRLPTPELQERFL
jgi:predicted DCC family thiol-disulfide oxidoreductase YuxK